MTASPARKPISMKARTEKSRRFPVLSTTAIELHCQFFGSLAGILSRFRIARAQRHLLDEPGQDKSGNGQGRSHQEHRVGAGRDGVLEAVDQIRLRRLELPDLGRGQLAEVASRRTR